MESGNPPRLVIPAPRAILQARNVKDHSRATRGHIRLELPPPLGQASPMADGDFDISYTAKLARIQLTDEEQREYGTQLAEVLQYVEKLKELDVDGVSPTAHPVPLTNVTRPDEVRPSLPTDEALSNAPAQANQLFLVPKIVD